MKPCKHTVLRQAHKAAQHQVDLATSRLDQSGKQEVGGAILAIQTTRGKAVKNGVLGQGQKFSISVKVVTQPTSKMLFGFLT